ncbi:hypothetical protein D3C80_1818810 [compost metagenome]
MGASFTNGGLYVGDQDRGVQRKYRDIGVFGSTDQADDSGGNGANGARALVDFEDSHAVMVFVGHGVCLRSDGKTLHRLPRARRVSECWEL